MSFTGSKAVHKSPAQLLFVIGCYSLDVPCVIHLCSSAVVAVTVVPGAGVYRERKEYYRCRICTHTRSPLNTTVHYFETEIVDPGEICYIAIGLTMRVSTDGLGVHIDTFITVLKIGDGCILLSRLK
jgi:hypothetical protein